MGKQFSAEFKLEAAKLVVDHHYTLVKAADAMNVSLSAMTRWANKLRLERRKNATRPSAHARAA
ncbi:transposase [Yersinia pekkanenii]|uniref:Transposase for insertion sequence element IS1666 n=1 Tax=Yersinia pekkanenii TaxID=1288385 RepID=A0A0T9RL64_9GAMM|nr:putative transposase for insertion sequence element IS1666 [Yersinia pekkanenii]CRY69582.1 putative transposase for insertion sequence element IS1666 [Yersinia pekkanenii]